MLASHIFFRRLVILGALAASLTACADTPPLYSADEPRTTVVAHIGVDRDFVMLDEGDQATVRIGTEALPTARAKWRSEDPSVAAVSSRGVISAIATGSTMISVTTARGSADVVVTVVPKNVQGVRHDRLR